MYGKTMCRQEIKQIWKDYGVRPRKITGARFPDNFLMFHNIINNDSQMEYYHTQWMNGEDVWKKKDTDVYFNFKLLRDRYENEIMRREKASRTYSMNLEEIHAMKANIRSEVSEQYKEAFESCYKDILEYELKHGFIRIMYEASYYDENARVEDIGCFMEDNFSPTVITLHDYQNKDFIPYTAARFAKASLFLECLTLIKIDSGQKITPEKLPHIVTMMEEVVEKINKYQIDEFHRKKDNPEYQYRYEHKPPYK